MKHEQIESNQMHDIVFITVFSVFALLIRLLPHAPNFAPIGALALFTGFYGKKPAFAIIPLSIMAISDLFLGLYDGRLMAIVYACYLLTFFIGRTVRTVKPIGIVFRSFAGSTLFFLITNLAVWAFSNWYSHSAAGLTQTYLVALPFYRNSLLGDLFYTTTFFGAYQLYSLKLKEHALRLVPQFAKKA